MTGDATLAPRLRADIERSGFDLVHDHSGFLGIAFSRYLATPMVHTVHCAFDKAAYGFYDQFKDAVTYIGISEYQQSMGPAGMDWAGLAYNAIAVEQWPYTPDKDDYLLAFGRVCEAKGFHLSIEDTIRNAGSFVQRGAQAVKLEGGAKRLPMIHALIDAEIPVMGHLGLTPQSVNPMGGFKVQGKHKADALRLVEDAQRLQDAGCFSMVLEGIPADLAAKVTETVQIPTIGIGAGPHCSGQVLVFHDVLGLLPGSSPKFVRRYAQGFDDLRSALTQWAGDVRDGGFPDERESYKSAR